MPARVSFTFDVEDHRSGLDPASRYVAATYRVLEFLGDISCTGTFFVVGTVAERFPALVTAIAGAGHEVAFHGYDHTPLDEDEPAKFLRDTRRGKMFLEDLIGGEVVGYRAPIFSLMGATTWCLESVASLGFTYSASVVPAPNPRRGFPGAPRQPFVWPGGVVELPAAVTSVAGISVPFLGGVYFRYFPTSMVVRRVEQSASGGLWTYLHPYDCDPDEGMQRVERTNALESFVLACNRRGTLRKMERLLRGRADAPLRDRVAAGEFAAALPVRTSGAAR
jgi:peptidoglycan-N-acetylglucosamine deacetylase